MGSRAAIPFSSSWLLKRCHGAKAIGYALGARNGDSYDFPEVPGNGHRAGIHGCGGIASGCFRREDNPDGCAGIATVHATFGSIQPGTFSAATERNCWHTRMKSCDGSMEIQIWRTFSKLL
jgi:hypothetical protein